MAETSAATLVPPAPTRRTSRAGSAGVGLALAVATVAAGATSARAAEYTVQQGDTVSHIALRTGTTVSAIVRANSLAANAFIRAGQTLTIPGTDGAAPSALAPAAPASTSHTVVPGDTVSALAQRYGTSISAIGAANGLDSRYLIRIGQTLTIPAAGAPAATTAPAPAPAAPAAAVTHVVRAGDTVSGLAARYGTTVQAIGAANGLDSRYLIRIGQTLSISGSASTVTPTTQLVGDTFAGRTYPGTTVAAANANKATLLSMQVPGKDAMRAKVEATARSMGVDPALALAIAHQESGFDQRAVSPANAIGTMQVIPTSGEWASQLVGRQLNLLDPDDNVTAGVAILRSLISSAPDLQTAIAGYYQGLAGVRKYGMYADTRRYVANVQTLMTRFR